MLRQAARTELCPPFLSRREGGGKKKQPRYKRGGAVKEDLFLFKKHHQDRAVQREPFNSGRIGAARRDPAAMGPFLVPLLALCLLRVGVAESEGGRSRCQLPPAWTIGPLDPMRDADGKVTVVALLHAGQLLSSQLAHRTDALRLKLEQQGLRDVIFMAVNHQEERARRLHANLQRRLSESITLYQQDERQPDVWRTLSGDEFDFFIYDRCGRLTHHISPPYSITGQDGVEDAIRDTYCNRVCGDCTHEGADMPEECKEKAAPGSEVEPGHGHGHHHGDLFPPNPGRDHHHGHHGHGQRALGQLGLHSDVRIQQTPQEAQGAPVMQRP